MLKTSLSGPIIPSEPPQCGSNLFPGIASPDTREEIQAFPPLFLSQGKVGPFSHRGTLLTHSDLTILPQIPS